MLVRRWMRCILGICIVSGSLWLLVQKSKSLVYKQHYCWNHAQKITWWAWEWMSGGEWINLLQGVWERMRDLRGTFEKWNVKGGVFLFCLLCVVFCLPLFGGWCSWLERLWNVLILIVLISELYVLLTPKSLALISLLLIPTSRLCHGVIEASSPSRFPSLLRLWLWVSGFCGAVIPVTLSWIVYLKYVFR